MTATDFRNLRSYLRVKAQLLAHGCSVAPGFQVEEECHRKTVHLYVHTAAKVSPGLPEDLVLGEGSTEVRARVRYNPASLLRLSRDEAGYTLHDADGHDWRVRVPPRPGFWGKQSRGTSLGSLFSMLGPDLLGVAPSNYCFYFARDLQCRFCEIVDSFRTEVEHARAVKHAAEIVEGVAAAVAHEPAIRHLAVTSGNLRSYDETCRMYIDLGRGFSELIERGCLHDRLATLMPPDTHALIDELVNVGYNKIYFPLEVWPRRLFELICPGKATYGYDRILTALDQALAAAGRGNVYTNLVYGIQSLDSNMQGSCYDPERENQIALEAVECLLARGIIPAFTVYHHGGFAPIGPITLCSEAMERFFVRWGELVHASGLVQPGRGSVIFGQQSLSNTIYNDGFALAVHRALV